MKLHKVSERKEYKGTCMLLFGAAGRGKTFFSASAGDRTVIITDGNGEATLHSPIFREKVKTDPYIVKINGDPSPSKPTAFDAIRNVIDDLFSDNKDDFDTLVIDDIDFVRESSMTKGIFLNGLINRSKTSANMRSPAWKDIIIQSQADYATEMRLVDSFLQQLTEVCRNEGKNLIVNAHERFIRKENDKGEEYLAKITPLFTGRDTPDNVARYFDLVWYIRTVGAGSNVKREFVTEPEGPLDCKTRWGGLFRNPERDLTAKQVFDRITTYQMTGAKP